MIRDEPSHQEEDLALTVKVTFSPPPERTLALTNINAPRLARRPNAALPEGGEDEPLAWEAREFLRKLVVGKTVLGCVVHSTATRWSLRQFPT